MSTKLEPADPKRCQAETVERTPWALGGTHKTTRCSNRPSEIATEKVAGKDGQTGSMSLCTPCKAVFLSQMGADYATFEAIKATVG